MYIKHEFIGNNLWVKAFVDKKCIGWITFVFHKNGYIYSASTFVEPKYRRAKVAQHLYMYAHNMGYAIKPSPLQSLEGVAMWKGFKKARLPFVKLNILERFIDKILRKTK